jgi:hypothetical protein
MNPQSLILALTLAALAVHAAPPPKPGEPNPFEPPRSLEKVTWLGLTSREAPPVVAEQLDLPKGTGLAVEMVLPDSPAAAAGVQPNDVLTKLDDQLLVNAPQLMVLVRLKKPGDKVQLTLLRKGKSQTVTATLAEHEAPAMPAFGNIQFGPNNPLEHFVPLGQGGAIMIHGAGEMGDGPGVMSTSQFSDGEHNITIQVRNGVKTVTVTGRDGKQVFSGPYNTDEEKAKAPAEIAAKIKQMEENQQRIPPEMFAPPPGMPDQM